MVPNIFTSPHEFTLHNSLQHVPIENLLDYKHQQLGIVVSIIPNCLLKYDTLLVPIKVVSNGLIGKIINQRISQKQTFMLMKIYEVLGLCSHVGNDWKQNVVKQGVTWEDLNKFPDYKFLVDWKYCEGSNGFQSRCFMQNIRQYVDEAPF